MTTTKKNARALRRSSLVNQVLRTGNIIRDTEPASYTLNPRSIQPFSWILGNLWREVDGVGSFGELVGDGVQCRILDSVIVEGGNVKQWIYTDKRGFVSKTESAKSNWAHVLKSFLPSGGGGTLMGSRMGSPTNNINDSPNGSPSGNGRSLRQNSTDTLDLSSLPCAIVHKENGDQTLIDSNQFSQLCHTQFPSDTVAVQRFVPPRGADLLYDENLTRRNINTMVGTYFYKFHFGSTNPICYKAGGEFFMKE